MNEFQMVREEIASLQEQLAEERARKEWCLNNAARIDGDSLVWGRPTIYAMSHHVQIVDGDVNAAIDAAVGGE